MYTEEEINEMQKSKSYWDRNDPNYKQINDDVSSWYKEHFSDKEEENETSPKEEKSNERTEEKDKTNNTKESHTFDESVSKDKLSIDKAYETLIRPDVEDRRKNIYYDTNGIPTIGVGTNIENKNVFMDVKFLHDLSQAPLNSLEKETLYQKVQALKPQLTKGEIYQVQAHKQHQFDNYFIDDSEQYRLAIKHLEEDLKNVKNKLSVHNINYEDVPPSAVAGALEIIYNVGPEQFKKFNHFMDDGIAKQDYTEAYKQSHRKNMKEKRYKAIQKFYDDAEREMQHKNKYGTWN